MIHLHVHSHYSLLCDASSPTELVALAADLGFDTLALNAMNGAVEFQKECEQRIGWRIGRWVRREGGPRPGCHEPGRHPVGGLYFISVILRTSLYGPALIR